MLDAKIINELAAIVGTEDITTDEAMLFVYSFDVSDVKGRPDAVVRPSSLDEISAIVKVCAREKIPVIPRGSGSGAAGGIVPITGGVVIDLTKMNDILNIDLENLQVDVQPGIIIDELNDVLRPLGFFYPVTPGSRAMATIGGTVANDASGMRAFKYGTAKDYLIAMKVIMADGTIVEIGGKSLKDVAGFDLLRLFAGSEGTLGIIGELRLKILPVPLNSGVLVVYFDDLHLAGRAAIKTYQSGVVPSAMEILERSALEAIKIYRPDLNIRVSEAMLLYELEGSLGFIKEQARKIEEMLESLGVTDHVFSHEPDEMEELWSARSLVGAASSVLRKGYNRVYEGEDICVPLSEIPRTLMKLREIRDKYGLGCIIFGHISIGSLHPAITIRKSNDADWQAVKQMANEIHEWAISVGGTVTGEHGIGVARKKYLQEMHPEAYEIMKKIKNALDPDNIMNPGKII
ncbi:MAG: FAD-binding oxidoreductase [Promethearchaeota archaeon]